MVIANESCFLSQEHLVDAGIEVLRVVLRAADQEAAACSDTTRVINCKRLWI